MAVIEADVNGGVLELRAHSALNVNATQDIVVDGFEPGLVTVEEEAIQRV